MKYQLSLFSFPEFSSAQYSTAREIIERFVVLKDQHSRLTEKLRELNGQNTVPAVAQSKWQDLKQQVADLRCEIENFKQVF